MFQKRAGQAGWLVALAAMTVALAGCTNFFVCQKSSCSTSSTSSSTVNYAYVSDSTTGTNYINGYVLTSGTLVAATSSPTPLSFTPSAMAVTTNNKFLYVGSNTLTVTGGAEAIYVYTIGTGGALSSGTALITANQVAAMAVSPDGQWLVTLTAADPVTLTTPQIVVYGINTSTGFLTRQTSANYVATSGVATPQAIAVAPSGQYIAVAMGTGGIGTYAFNTSTGLLGAENTIPLSSGAAFDVAIDSNNYMFVAATGNLLSFTVTSSGVPTATPISSPATSGTQPFSVALDGTSYVWAGAGGSTIFGFANAGSGTLTAMSPASTAGPTSLDHMAMDSTGKYLLAVGYSTASGLQMYSIGSSGGLTLTSSVGTAAVPTAGYSTVPAVLALTH